MAKTTLGEYVRNLRNKRDLGVRELGRKVKVSGVHISSIEKNKATPSPELLNKFDEIQRKIIWIDILNFKSILPILILDHFSQ